MGRFNVLKKITFLFTVSLTLYSTYSYASVGEPAISLLNVGTGYLPYTWASRTNQYLGFNYANELTGYRENASWYPIYNSNGTVSFKDVARNYCIQHYSTDYRVIQNPCDSNNLDQQFDLEPTKTGALLMKFRSNGECLYGTSGGSDSPDSGYAHSGQCKHNNSDYYWAMIPPLKAEIKTTVEHDEL